MTDSPQPQRRWFRFSLRTLLLLVTVACIAFGWLGYKVRQVQRQKEAVAAVTKLGGFVDYDYQYNFSPRFPQDRAVLPGPKWLRTLLGIDFLADAKAVIFAIHDNRDAKWAISDAELVHLQGLTNLERLDLINTKVTDAGLVHLQGLKQLKRLVLDGTCVSDAGCQELKKSLPNLTITR